MTSVIHRIIENQIRTWEAEAAKRRVESREFPEAPQKVRPCIAIARMIGSGGGEIAQRVASRLGWQILDREIVEVIIRQGNFREAIMSFLDERDRSSVELWVDGLLHGSIVDKGDYYRSLVRVLTSVSMHGHAIILGRGGNFVLDPRRTLHVRTVAPRAVRIEAISRLRGMPANRAAALVRQTDHERAAFVMQYFHNRIDDATAYDLTLNTASFSREEAAELVIQALHRKLGGLEKVELSGPSPSSR